MERFDFHTFVQHVVGLFKHQRKEGHQFALLYLTSQDFTTSMCTANVAFRTALGIVQTPEDATDNEVATFPPSNLCNFIVARPDGPHHTEALLLERFDDLMESYGSFLVRSIVLYTWLLPCVNCMNRIIDRLRYLRDHLKVIVIYTSNGFGVTQEKADRIIQDLREAGIIVVHEIYDYSLHQSAHFNKLSAYHLIPEQYV